MPPRSNPKILNNRIRQPRGMNTGATRNLYSFDSAPANHPDYWGDERTALVRAQEEYEKTRRVPFVENTEAIRLYRQSASNDPLAEVGKNGRFPDTQRWPDRSQLNSRYKPELTIDNPHEFHHVAALNNYTNAIKAAPTPSNFVNESNYITDAGVDFPELKTNWGTIANKSAPYTVGDLISPAYPQSLNTLNKFTRTLDPSQPFINGVPNRVAGAKNVLFSDAQMDGVISDLALNVRATDMLNERQSLAGIEAQQRAGMASGNRDLSFDSTSGMVQLGNGGWVRIPQNQNKQLGEVFNSESVSMLGYDVERGVGGNSDYRLAPPDNILVPSDRLPMAPKRTAHTRNANVLRLQTYPETLPVPLNGSAYIDQTQLQRANANKDWVGRDRSIRAATVDLSTSGIQNPNPYGPQQSSSFWGSKSTGLPRLDPSDLRVVDAVADDQLAWLDYKAEQQALAQNRPGSFNLRTSNSGTYEQLKAEGRIPQAEDFGSDGIIQGLYDDGKPFSALNAKGEVKLNALPLGLHVEIPGMGQFPMTKGATMGKIELSRVAPPSSLETAKFDSEGRFLMNRGDNVKTYSLQGDNIERDRGLPFMMDASDALNAKRLEYETATTSFLAGLEQTGNDYLNKLQTAQDVAQTQFNSNVNNQGMSTAEILGLQKEAERASTRLELTRNDVGVVSNLESLNRQKKAEIHRQQYEQGMNAYNSAMRLEPQPNVQRVDLDVTVPNPKEYIELLQGHGLSDIHAQALENGQHKVTASGNLPNDVQYKLNTALSSRLNREELVLPKSYSVAANTQPFKKAGIAEDTIMQGVEWGTNKNGERVVVNTGTPVDMTWAGQRIRQDNQTSTPQVRQIYTLNEPTVEPDLEIQQLIDSRDSAKAALRERVLSSANAKRASQGRPLLALNSLGETFELPKQNPSFQQQETTMKIPFKPVEYKVTQLARGGANTYQAPRKSHDNVVDPLGETVHPLDAAPSPIAQAVANMNYQKDSGYMGVNTRNAHHNERMTVLDGMSQQQKARRSPMADAISRQNMRQRQGFQPTGMADVDPNLLYGPDSARFVSDLVHVPQGNMVHVPAERLIFNDVAPTQAIEGQRIASYSLPQGNVGGQMSRMSTAAQMDAEAQLQGQMFAQASQSNSVRPATVDINIDWLDQQHQPYVRVEQEVPQEVVQQVQQQQAAPKRNWNNYMTAGAALAGLGVAGGVGYAMAPRRNPEEEEEMQNQIMQQQAYIKQMQQLRRR